MTHVAAARFRSLLPTPVLASLLAGLALGGLLGSPTRAIAQSSLAERLRGQRAGNSLDQPAKEYGIPGYSVRDWLQADATLRDVTFIDPDRGWAVGDRGVVLFSDSGGDRWESQTSNTIAPLLAVDFVDANNGVAVGGYYESDSQTSRGVLLMTRDGGRNWTRLPAPLPLLRDVRVQADGTLLVAGDFSVVHGGAVLLSHDGGRNWMAAPTDNLPRASRLAGQPDGSALVLGADGLMNRFSTILQSAQPVLSDARLQTVLGTGPQRMAVGNNGSLYVSGNDGQSWRASDVLQGSGPSQTAIDIYDAALVDGALVCVGAPGNRIAVVDSAGQVAFQDTPVHSPLRAVTFHGPQRGWAVGAFGTILATRDGGRSWRIQRGDDLRTAMLVVGQTAEDIPWSAFATESLEKGRRIAVATLQSTAARDPLVPDATTLLAQVACGLGGGEAVHWRTASTPVQADLQSIGVALATYRPRVLLLSDTIDSDLRRQWIEAASRQGVQRVLEPTSKPYSEWTVHRKALLPRTGTLLSDLGRDAAATLQARNIEADEQHYRRTFDAIVPLGRPINDLLDGYVDNGLQDTRTIQTSASRRSLQVLQGRAGEPRMLTRMLADGDRNGSFLQRIRLSLGQTPRENRERLAREILRRCEQTNQPRLYRQTLAVVTEQMPDTPLGKWAVVRLQAIKLSDEWDRLQRVLPVRDNRTVATASSVKLSPFEAPADADVASLRAGASSRPANAGANLLDAPARGLQQASAVEELIVTPEYETGASPSGELSRGTPDLVWDLDPRVTLVRHLLAIDRSAGDESPQLGILKQFGSYPDTQGWGELLNPSEAVGNRIARTQERPYLDGKLTEPCWQSATAIETPAGYTLRLAYDSQHLYWSATGPLPEPSAATSSSADHRATRSRDAEMDDSQRILLKIDTDGDLLTAYGFEVDRRGRTRDTCDGFTNWQPMWFVDTRVEGNQWTVEAAVRRSGLTDLPPLLGSTWNVSLITGDANQCGWHRQLPSSYDWHVARYQ